MRAEAAGLTVLLATCEPHGGAGPYGAWRELLLPLIGADWDDPETAVVARLRAAVAERAHDLEPWIPLLAATLGAELPDTPAVAALAPAFRADRLHDAVVRFLAASLPDATVLVIEHAHDMDAASAALLGAVLDALPAHPWLILLTRRDAPWDAAPPPGPGRTALPLDAARARGGARAGAPPDRGHAAAAAGARARRGPRGRQPAVPARPARRRRGRRRRADRDAGGRGHRADRPARPARPHARAPRRGARHELPPAHARRRRVVRAARRDLRRGRRRLAPVPQRDRARGRLRRAAVQDAPAAACRRGRAAGGRGLGRARRARGRPLAALLPRRRPPARLGLCARGGGARPHAGRARRRRAAAPARARRREGRRRRRRRHRGHLGRARGGAGAQRQSRRGAGCVPPRPRARRRRRAPRRRGAAAPDRARRPRRPRAAGDALRPARAADARGRARRRGRAAAARGCSPRWP